MEQKQAPLTKVDFSGLWIYACISATHFTIFSDELSALGEGS